MIRFRLFMDFAREEAWLNEMARQGWELTAVSLGNYHFRQAEQNDTKIRIDFREFSNQTGYESYITLFEDSGWQHLAGTRTSGAQYFKRVSPDSTEDIFSDALSRAMRYRRFAGMWLTLAATMLVLLTALAVSGSLDLQAIIKPKLFYLTPGLWEREGAAFWKAFLFETPFALMRALLVYFMPVPLILYLVNALHSYRLFMKEKNRNVEA